MKLYFKIQKLFILISLLALFGCSEDDETLVSYIGQERNMSNVLIEEGVLKPKITWVGGYVAVLGVNQGNTAVLDSSLVWLIKMDENNIHYPVTFGETPAGAQDITSQFGGTAISQLNEDNTYTIWVMKAEAWQKIESGKPIFSDTTMTAETVVESKNDTLLVNADRHTQETITIDLFVNLDNIKEFGKLGIIHVEQPKTSNNPLISWTITQADTLDSLISAIGIVEGQQYVATRLVWEVWSQETVNDQNIYGKKNIISPPVIPGQEYSGSRVFAEYPEAGLERDKDYYIWIANKYWDGKSRSRITKFYAYLTFHTW